MLRRILEKVIVEYAGDYIEDFNRDQLKFTAFKGEILLQQLQLRCSALQNLTKHLPLTILACHIGLIKIKIPWNKLKREQVVVQAQGITLVIAPQDVDAKGSPGESWAQVLKRQQVCTIIQGAS